MPDVVPAAPQRLLLACGLTTLDVVQTVEHVPSADEKLVATNLLVGSGGPAANAAVTCVALGVPARLLTRIGGGALGRAVAADLVEHGIEVVDRAGPTAVPAVSTVLVTRATGQRAVVSVNATRADAGGSGAGVADDDLDRLLERVSVVLVDGHNLDLALAVAAAAHDRGVPVVFDGGSWKPGLERLLRLVDMAVLSADFRAPGLDGAFDAAAALRMLLAVADAGPRLVARSQGGGPIQVLRDGGIEEIAVRAALVADTLGAGDALHGALCAWLARHDGEGLDRGAGSDAAAAAWGVALAYAADVASTTCTAPGARGWLTDRAQVALMRDRLGER